MMRKAYCWRCNTYFDVDVTPAEIKESFTYTECQCGKSGGFPIVTAEEALREQEKEKENS